MHPETPDRGPDERLRERLAATDPAASLRSADPAARDRLLEETMAARPDPARDVAVRPTAAVYRRRRLTVLGAAAAAVAVLVGGTALLTRGGDDVAPVAAPPPAAPAAPSVPTSPVGRPSEPASTSSQDGAPTRLTVLTAPARCAVPSAAVLGQQTLAFEGTVTSLDGGLAVLVPTQVYAGRPGPEVTVQAPSADLQALVSAVGFEAGGDYLVAATDGRVAVCGLSGPATASLASLYADAFDG